MRNKTFLKNILIFCSYFIYTYLALILLTIPLTLLNIDIVETSDLFKYIIILLMDIIYIVFLIITFYKPLKEKIKDFKSNFSKYIDIGIKYWILGLFIMVVSNKVITIFTSVEMAQNESAVRELFTEAPIYTLLGTVLFAPIVEEIIFRKTIKNLINTKWLYIIFSGFIFGAVHVVSNLNAFYDLLFIIPYGALGAAFACAYYKTNNIFVPIVLHAIHNGILIAILFFI
ncbi:MAG: CPBP family intramembrane glutamic endopeptidase [Bacilli bacterium]